MNSKAWIHPLMILMAVLQWFPANAEAGAIKEVTQPVIITMAGRSASGASLLMGETVGECIRRKIPGSSFTYEPGQDGANAVSVATGRTELGIDSTITGIVAYEGRPPHKKAYKELRSIADLQDGEWTFCVLKKSGLKSLTDITKRKYPIKLGVNRKDGMLELTNRIVLEAHGITYKDIDGWGGKVYFVSVGQSVDMMKDGRLDGFMCPFPNPMSALIEASVTLDLELLPIENIYAKEIERQTGGKIQLIPKVYKFMDKEILSVTVPSLLVTGAKQSEELIYTITKALFENLDYIRSSHRMFEPFSPAFALNVGPIPLHPGAKRYYQEIGALK